MDQKIREAFNQEEIPKFLATASKDGVPNIVPVFSLESPEDDTLIFGEMMLWKTRKNLEENTKVGAVVLTRSLKTWAIVGSFQGFQKTGPWVDLINSRRFFRYNAYSGIRNAGVIKVERVYDINLNKALLLRDTIRPGYVLRFGKGVNRKRIPLPDRVREKFARIKAVKAISYLTDDEYPLAILSFGMYPSFGARMCFPSSVLKNLSQQPVHGQKMAASVITLDATAYQVKGVFQGWSRRGRLGWFDVKEAYTAAPPLPGERIT